MWNSYWNGRSRRNIPQVNYNESSSEEEFDSPLQSPTRPLPTREGSPVELAVPTLNDNVDEELEAVSRTLSNVAHTHTFRGTRPYIGARPDPEGGEVSEAQDPHIHQPTEVGEEEVLEGHIVGAAVNLKVEAGEDEVENEVEDDNGAAATAALAANMPDLVNFEDENGQDEERALMNAIEYLKDFHFDMSDLDFVFGRVEIKMKSVGVKKNYTKFEVLSSIIPRNVQNEVKHILRKKETELGTDSYKKLKKEIYKIFGPKDESHFNRAMSRVLTGLPSQLARQLVGDLCPDELVGCHCSRFIVGLWKKQLPANVRSGIAGMKFNAENFENICTHADDIFTSNPRPSGVAVAAITSEETPRFEMVPVDPYVPPHNRTFYDPPDPEVAALRGAYGRGRGGGSGRGAPNNRGGRGNFRGSNRGGGRGSNRGSSGGGGNGGNGGGNSSGSGGRHAPTRWPNVTRHADQPPVQSCRKHWQFGKTAHWCEEPASCPWKDFFTPK